MARIGHSPSSPGRVPAESDTSTIHGIQISGSTMQKRYALEDVGQAPLNQSLLDTEHRRLDQDGAPAHRDANTSRETHARRQVLLAGLAIWTTKRA